MRALLAAMGVGACAAAAAAQVQLDARITVDNVFEAYISTSDQLPGTQFLSGGNWQTPVSGSTMLPGPGTYFLHVRGEDLGPPAMFIGEFSLGSALATFANGTQSLLTNTADWRVSSTGFDMNYVTPGDLGGNGTGPWGNASGISPDARYLWHPNGGAVAYFSTTVTVVPAPGGIAALGLIGVMGSRRKRR